MTSTISIIINNYNYGRFLDETIQSILNQSQKPHEVIVVDDGSTDNSREILTRYDTQVKIVLKMNGGQASAFNRGYAEATGEWIWYVDADDFLVTDAVKIVDEALGHHLVDLNRISKIHSPLFLIKDDVGQTITLYPNAELSSGSVINEVITKGDYRWPPTTGNIFNRTMMEKCMPIPEEDYRICADFYLCSFAPFSGSIVQTPAPVGCYRVHPQNSFYGGAFTKERLTKNGQILMLVEKRTTQLVRANTMHKDYVFPFTRRSLESLVIAKRFGSINFPAELSWFNLYKKWLNAEEIRTASFKTKIIAFSYWVLLNAAPKRLTAFLIKRGMKKLNRSK